MKSIGFLNSATRLLAVAVLASAPLWAQLNRGVIEGTVTDPQAATVPGVTLTVTDVETGISQTLRTNNVGYYRAEDLTPGNYRIEFVASGFARLEVGKVEVIAGQVLRQDATLKLGATQQTVEVSGASPLLQTDATNWSTGVSSTVIEDLPLAGRDLQNLVNLLPGVNNAFGPPGTLFGFNSAYGSFPDLSHTMGSQISVSGGQVGANAWYLDGDLDLSALAQNMAIDPAPDSVSEFQAVTNSLAAQYGYTGGGVFNVVLKSGTNQLHGDLYEFVQNSAFNARNPFTSINSTGQIIPQAQIRYNQFGGTLGGPVYIPHIYDGKNRTFFFFSDDATVLHDSNSNSYTVPTPLMREGNFSEVPNAVAFGMWNPYSTVGPDPQTGLFDRTAFGTPVPGNPYGALGCHAAAVASGANTCNFSTQIPTNMLNQYAMFFINSFPLPNFNNPQATCVMSASGPYKICSNYLATVGQSQDQQNISLKVDEKWSDKSMFFGEWLFNPGKFNNYRVPWTGPTFPESGLGTSSPYPISFANTIIAFGNAYTFSPTTLNEFRLNFTRQYINTNPSQPYPNSINDQAGVVQELSPLDLPGLSPYYPTPNFSIGTPEGGVTFGPTPWSNSLQTDQSITLMDNVTHIQGKNTIKAGFMYIHNHTVLDIGCPNTMAFSGDLVSNPIDGEGSSGLAQFMMGSVSDSGGVSTCAWNSVSESFPYYGFYGQDDYRVTPNFTLNVGLRYDLYVPYSVNNYPASNFCFNCLNSQTGLPGEVVYQGGPGYTGVGSRVGSPNKHDFAPRFNFAWSPAFGGHKTVLRGGYDIVYSNAYEGLAGPGEGGSNEPGWYTPFAANKSDNPTQCASYSGECEIYPFAPTAYSKASQANYTSTFPAQTRSPLYADGIQYMGPPTKDPMVQMWNFQIERQLPGNLTLSVGYVGNHGTHLLGDWQRSFNFLSINTIRQYKTQLSADVPITNFYSGNTAAMLQNVYGSADLPISLLSEPYPFYGTIVGGSDVFDGTSAYNALQVKVEKHFSTGLSFIAVYTNSKTMSNAALGGLQQVVTDANICATCTSGRLAAEYGTILGERYQNLNDRDADRSVAAYDLPQIFNLSASYKLPAGGGQKFLNRKGILNALIGNWVLTPSFNAQSGFPLAISCPGDQVTGRCDMIGNPRAVPGGQNAAHWINPGAFQPPFGPDTNNFWANYDPNADIAYNYGTAGPVLPQLRAPGFWNLDTSLKKEFHITEVKYFDLRWDLLNALNHQNLASPSTGFCLPPLSDGTVDLVHQAGCGFGQIHNVQNDPRNMQFAMKFHW